MLRSTYSYSVRFSSFFLFIVLSPVFAQNAQTPARLEVDLREAPKHIFHAMLSLPVKAGPLTLVCPKWIPGEHSPTGPISDLVGLKFMANGKEIPWHRDDLDMYAFHVETPSVRDAVRRTKNARDAIAIRSPKTASFSPLTVWIIMAANVIRTSNPSAAGPICSRKSPKMKAAPYQFLRITEQRT